MIIRRPANGLVSSILLIAALACQAASADTITIEPDNYTGDISNVAPGARLSAFRSDGADGFVWQPLRSVAGGAWSPTGTRVFGFQPDQPWNSPYHWENLADAYACEHDHNCFLMFSVLRVDFDAPTSGVSILTTMRGEQALDGAELQAFDANGERLLRCRIPPVSWTVLQTGAMPAPRYWDNTKGSGAVCGVVLEKKNCDSWGGTMPGNCDYVVRANVKRWQRDIAYVWFGGNWYNNSHAPADKLTYILH